MKKQTILNETAAFIQSQNSAFHCTKLKLKHPI